MSGLRDSLPYSLYIVAHRRSNPALVLIPRLGTPFYFLRLFTNRGDYSTFLTSVRSSLYAPPGWIELCPT